MRKNYLKINLITCLLVSFFFLLSCQKEEGVIFTYYSDSDYQEISKTLNLPPLPYDYSLSLPRHLFSGSTNRINVGQDNKATLGRVLFYDTRLSATNEVSCASCHKQEFAFSDNENVSAGIRRFKTTRNSLSLASAPSLVASYSGQVSSSAFGWDHSHEDSRRQSLAALLDSNEMGNANLSEIKQKLWQDPAIQILTEKAFGNLSITNDQLLESLDAFMNSIGVFETRFDHALKTKEAFTGFGNFDSFTEKENIGKNLYMINCASCHGIKFDVQQKLTANNGLDLVYADKGVGTLKGQKFDGHFKVPFLRNIALTAPYMHDGRFATLREVVDHYSDNIQAHPNLSPELLKGLAKAKKMNFTEDQKDALVAFFHTLTDETVLNEEKYSNPFLE